ncbi:MAG: ABC transporter substrate-binding protein [Alphaproteobacteria bacterium]|nr:ABC transporter substrate-binding protein [Alphaproteobacteria bacterium]MBF0249038.1 ABC transporter substrate-binding protein [Alphaproteobacteria bacterium]
MKSIKKNLVAGAATAVMGFAGAAQADGLKIGALMPMTGGLQAYGVTSLNGVNLAADQINAAGGVNGGKLEVVVGDTQTSAQPGVAAAKKLVSVEGVSALVGALSSGVTIPIAQTVAAPNGVPQISGASTAPAITSMDDQDFLFRTVPTDAVQGVGMAELAAEAGIKNAAVIYVNNDYGKGLAEAFAAAFTRKGGAVAQSVAFEEKQASFRGELQKAASGGATHLVLIAYPESGIPILKQSLEGGYFMKFVFSDGMKANDIVDAIGAEYLDGAFGTTAESAGDAAKIYQAAFEAKYGPTEKPYSDTAYDATMILALAAAKAGSSDPKAIRDALRDVANAPGEAVLPGEFAKGVQLLKAGKDIDYVGASGPVDFDANGDVSGTFAHWVIENGRFVTKKVFVPGS